MLSHSSNHQPQGPRPTHAPSVHAQPSTAPAESVGAAGSQPASRHDLGEQDIGGHVGEQHVGERVWIALTGVTATGHHGVLPQERRDGQAFVVDLRLEVVHPVGEDDLDTTVNYAEVATRVVDLIGGEPVDLIETLAGRIADVCLAFPPVQTVEVCVHKPEAPIGVPFTDVSVTLVRSRA